MRIVNKKTGKILATIICDYSRTLDELIELMGIKVMVTEQDYIDGNGYDYDDLDLVED